MKIHGKSLMQGIIFMMPIFFSTIMIVYFASYFVFKDLIILKQPCGKREPQLAIFRYFGNYNNNYGSGIEVSKFSYFSKKDFNFYSIYKPLEKIELYIYDFNHVTLSNSQIADLKKEVEYYRDLYKEMQIYEYFDESKLKD